MKPKHVLNKVERTIYFDHAAATPLALEVRAAMEPFFEEQFYNASSLYSEAREVRKAIEEARARVAKILGARKAEIVFTAGGTESVNLAIFGMMRSVIMKRLPNPPMLKFITTSIEHDAVLAGVRQLNAEGRVTELVPVSDQGVVDPAAIGKAIDDQTILVTVMYANNEIGTIQPLAEIGKIIEAVRADRKKRGVDLPIYFHTDATQAPNYLDLHVSRLGVDMMTLNGSKIYGPKQSGCLYVRTGVEIGPMLMGGGQERNLRSGTENVAGIIGLATALELVEADRNAESKRLAALRDAAWKQVQRLVPEAILNGHSAKRLANNLNFSIPGIDGEQAVLYLDKQGIMVSTGSACSTGNAEPSHVLLALGRSEVEANGSLRLSFGRSTTQAEVDYFLEVLPAIVTRLRGLR
jgi:cysteine desulfurase